MLMRAWANPDTGEVLAEGEPAYLDARRVFVHSFMDSESGLQVRYEADDGVVGMVEARELRPYHKDWRVVLRRYIRIRRGIELTNHEVEGMAGYIVGRSH